MVWEVAPAARIPVMAAWLREATRALAMSWYSLLVSKITLELDRKWVATVFQKVSKPAVSVIMLP